jgi:acyl-CoA reductase-like NAD-dependent aldehyde dehydrogenase
MTLTASRHQMFINGEWTDAASGETARVINPATEEEIAQVPKGDASDVDRAVAGARAAFDTWSQTTPAARAKAL